MNTKIIGMNEKTALFVAPFQRKHSRLCLFKLNILGDKSLAATIRFKHLEPRMDVKLGFYMGYETSNLEELCFFHAEISSLRISQVQEKTIMLSFPTTESRLVEFGVYIVNFAEDPEPLALCHILNLTIKPRTQPKSSWTIHSVRLMEKGHSPDHARRLVWKWSGSDDPRLTGLPWSTTTGPFSLFDIITDGNEYGRAYCTEFPVHHQDFRGCKGKGMEVVIRGRLFGGGEIASLPLQLSEDEVGVL